jgi:hypothetical protein
MIAIVSTGYRSPNEARCRESVLTQRLEELFRHIYIEASEVSPSLCALENRWHVYQELKPDDIVVELDGDDWLAHDHVLEVVAKQYEDPACWMTFGSFVHADGRPGFCRPYGANESFRSSAWRASHLKTFRAGLFQRINRRDLIGPGEGPFCEHARDLVTMLPMLEMAGHDHVRYIPEILYVYDLSTSFEWNTDARGMKNEQDCVAWARSRPEYAQVLSWST